MVQLLFEDIFTLEALDPDGKKLDKDLGNKEKKNDKDKKKCTIWILSPGWKKHNSTKSVTGNSDPVSRIEARSEQFDMYLQLDVNTEAYPLHVGDKFTMVLAPTLSLDGTPDSYFTQGGRESLADKFEYAMHGKLYNISVEGSGANVKVEIYASFGGLLMMLTGYPANAANFELNQRLFLLMRKV